jgi:hypothetical protein
MTFLLFLRGKVCYAGIIPLISFFMIVVPISTGMFPIDSIRGFQASPMAISA